MIDRHNREHSVISIKGHLNAKHMLLEYVYTIIICLLIAVFLSLVGISKPFLANLAMSLSFGLSICTLINMLFWVLNPYLVNTLSISLTLMSGLLGGMVIGSQVGHFILQRFFSVEISDESDHLLKSMVLAIFFGGTVCYFFYSRARLKIAREEAEKERMNRLASEKEALASNLRLLQAQIEPHFLFNTLSNILSLIDTEPAKGKSMLMDLIHYLRTSLSRTLPDTTTLGQEIDTIEAYLNIQKIRLGDRLKFAIDVPETLRQYPFPPMLLQPLVENAIKHGLEPKIDGGDIRVIAVEKGESILIEVADTGLGLSSFNASGVGIANVRERIKLMYNEKGHLLLEENTPNGLRAIIEVPRRET
jgi:sensor histidine kinase YesM